MTHLRNQKDKLKKVSVIRKGEKWKKVAIGVVWLTLAVVFEVQDLFPQLVRNIMLVFAGYCMAGDLVRSFAGFLPAAIADIRAALKGTNGKDRSDSTETD